MKPPSEMGFPDDVVLRVVKSLRGIPESRFHWYLTYLEHHITNLVTSRSRVDPCW